MEEAFAEDDEDGADENDRRVRRRMDKQEVRMLSSQVKHLRREVADVRAERTRQDEKVHRRLDQINNNVLRLCQAPARRVVPAPANNPAAPSESNNIGNAGTGDERRVPTLSRLPRTLHDLWFEWEFGFAGKKPARLFTAAERGKVKHTFYKRKFFWNKCAEMVRCGMTADRACDKIYEVYGQSLSVTNILEQLKRDHITRGGHPQLRIEQL